MRRNLPSTTALLCFERVARLGGFTAAADDLALTQSAVSRQVSQLEALLGRRLLDRTPKGVVLTHAGRRYLELASDALGKLAAATDALHDEAGGAPTLTVGVYPTFGARWLVPRALPWDAAHPEVGLDIATFPSNADLDLDLVDLAIVQGDPPFPGAAAEMLMPERLGLVAAPAIAERLRAEPEALGEARFLAHGTRPEAWRIWTASAGLAGLTPARRLVFWQYEMIIAAMLIGHGVAVTPLLLIEDELAEGRLALAHPHVATPPSAYHVLTPNTKVSDTRVAAFRRWLLEGAGAP